jgi:glycosyltransferase involved in cell wall biosynthesis
VTVAGDGPERARLEAQAAHHGLDARFEGNVGRDRLDTLYREAACVVLASRRGERIAERPARSAGIRAAGGRDAGLGSVRTS